MTPPRKRSPDKQPSVRIGGSTRHPPPLRDGVPLKREYDNLVRSAVFEEMEAFSQAFLERNRNVLRRYIGKWGAENPFRAWSRQWEYPYVFSKVAKVVRDRPQAKILDAGSGATFFPFYLRHCFPGTTVACCDSDPALKDVFSQLNQTMRRDIDFSTADIRTLPYDDRSFDLVYCVSVLEHTDRYEEIVHELQRVSSGGEVVITFDVCLDGTRDVRLEHLDGLLEVLAAAFGRDQSEVVREVRSQLSNPAIVTTCTVNPNLLPWRGPPFLHRLKSSLVNRRLVHWPPSLAVCCLSGDPLLSDQD